MNIRDRVRNARPDALPSKRGAFLDAPGAYRIQISSFGEFESSWEDSSDRFWKLEGEIVEADDGSTLKVGDAIAVIHNLQKDKYGFSRDERREIMACNPAPGGHILCSVEPGQKKDGGIFYKRVWFADDTEPEASEADAPSNEGMPF